MNVVLWVICYGLWPLVAFCLRPLNPGRVDFERKNLKENAMGVGGQKFNAPADVAFEVSSEGELEQIRVLLVELLDRGKCVELLYCSRSVEGNIYSLAKSYPRQLKTLRLPLLTAAPRWGRGQSALHFLTAPVLVLCRYDFFPELLLYGIFSARRFILLSATCRGKGALIKRLFYRRLFGCFDLILPATSVDRREIEQLLDQSVLPEIDLRVLRIVRRLSRRQQLFSQRNLLGYVEFIRNWPREQRLILGQCYASELKLLEHPLLLEKIRQQKLLVCLCPHHLEKVEVGHMAQAVRKLCAKNEGLEFAVVGEEGLARGEFSPFHLLELRGVLCELYHYFSVCYVGGGFERSIHSVLEPYLAGSHVICGPRVHRSAEFALVDSQAGASLTTIVEQSQFFTAYQKVVGQKNPDQSFELAAIMEERYQKLLGEFL